MQKTAERILLFIPMYNCEKQISRVLLQLNPDVLRLFAEVIVVDNRSPDQSVKVAKETIEKKYTAKIKILQNTENYGLGGSHKVAFDYAIANQFDYCIVLHGDDQGSVKDVIPYLDRGLHRDYDCLLGARFMPASRLVGYSKFRTFGNKMYNMLYSLVCGKKLYDLGAGLNVYAVSFLKRLNYHCFADDLTFNYYAVLATVAIKSKIYFFPLSWREEDQISNVKLVRQSIKGLKILADFFLNKQRFLEQDHSRPNVQKPYTAKEISLASPQSFSVEKM